MDISAFFILLLILAVLLAGISKGGFGSGASFICIPILALVIEPTQALGIMLPLLMVMDAVSLTGILSGTPYTVQEEEKTNELIFFSSMTLIKLIRFKILFW